MRFRGLLIIKARACSLVVVAMAVAPGTAIAQNDSQRTGAARALYDQAVTEMATGDYENACLKLEASVKLEPAALGARITLAECYEGDGRLASAWSTYLQAEGVAATAKQAARQTKAHDRAEALRPRLAQLTLVVPQEVQSLPGLMILRDGLEIEGALWSVPIPVDRGTHELVVTATDKKRVAQSFEVERDGQSVTVKLPRLHGAPPPPAPILRPAERAPARETPSLPRVHIESDDPSRPLELFRVDSNFSGSGTGYGAGRVDGVVSSPVCSAPCDIGVDIAGGRYFFLGGEGITTSERFQLRGRGDPATLRVSPGSAEVRGAGVAAVILGLTSVVVGAPMLAFGAAVQGEDATTVTAAGGVTLGLGVALTILSVPVLRAGRTTFRFQGDGVTAEF